MKPDCSAQSAISEEEKSRYSKKDSTITLGRHMTTTESMPTNNPYRGGSKKTGQNPLEELRNRLIHGLRDTEDDRGQTQAIWRHRLRILLSRPSTSCTSSRVPSSRKINATRCLRKNVFCIIFYCRYCSTARVGVDVLLFLRCCLMRSHLICRKSSLQVQQRHSATKAYLSKLTIRLAGP